MKLYRSWVGPCGVQPLAQTVRNAGLRCFGGTEHLYIEAESAEQIAAQTGLTCLSDAQYHADVGSNTERLFARN